MGDWGGTVPSFTAGQVLTAADLDTIADILTALTGDWSPWTPSLTNLTAGSTPVVARYRRIGHTVDWYFRFGFSSGAAVGSNQRFTLPIPMHPSIAVAASGFPGEGSLLDTGNARRQPLLVVVDAQTVEIRFWNSTPTDQVVTATAPWTWATGDKIDLWGVYEGA